MDDEAVPAVLYEDLAALEQKFDDADTEIIRQQYAVQQDLYDERQTLIAKIPNFWPLVLEQAPADVSNYIQPSDSAIFAKCLIGLEVRRFELDQDRSKEPRSISIRLDFASNEWFENQSLEKKFWYRRAEDGWTGLVSEPVDIAWKTGKDPTRGLTRAVRALWDAREKAGDMRTRDLPEFDALSELVEKYSVRNTSFFTWFAHVSSRRWVSEEESAKAMHEKKQQSTNDEESPSEPDDDPLEQQVEVDEEGEDLASSIVNDLWPGAIKYFILAQEDDEADELDESESEDDTVPDLAAIIQAEENGRPSKKQKQ